MDLSNLKPAAGATKKGKRIGRGQGSGRGGTSTKGHNGQKSRSGASIPAWFEGGQMPLMRRIPKFGFTNRNRVEYKAVNLMNISALLESGKLSAGEISLDDMKAAGLAKKKELVKILGRGEITAAIKVEAHKCSASAKAKIEAAGGSVTLVALHASDEAAEAKEEVKAASKKKDVAEDSEGAEKNNEASDASDAEQA